MVQQQTLLKVADNSGAKTVKCIKILGGLKRKFASIGDIIVVAVQQLRNKSKITSKVQKGEVHKALIIRTTKKIRRKNGLTTFFTGNYVTLVNKQNNPVSSRIVGPISKRLKSYKFMKFTTISAGFI
jgi:large subunit ribosomal protein L14